MRKLKIKEVFIFSNGFTAVIDENGEQIPKLQGKWEKVYKKVLKKIDNETIFKDIRARF